ncbi:MAG: site-specific DNA-methyltransferase [Deltaproteobacteria bacterium]|nr:site-specific DNA-methyltransferase [Deltaproteobacteria bacterium]
MKRRTIGNHTFICADACEALRTLSANSVHCIVTSPPYLWARRYSGQQAQIWGGDPKCKHEWEDGSWRRRSSDSGDLIGNKQRILVPWAGDVPIQYRVCRKCGAWHGELGLEPDPKLYVEHIVEVMRECKRVLRDNGILWLNLGDTYANAGGKGLKRTDLIGMPWRVAFALQEDGWYLRQCVIWAKGHSCQRQLEDIVAEAAKAAGIEEEKILVLLENLQPYVGNAMPESVKSRPTTTHEYIFMLTKRPSGDYYYDYWASKEKGRRSLRSVWAIPPRPFSGTHFAVMPIELAELCIRLSTSEHGCCAKCGTPYQRIVEAIGPDEEWKRACGADKCGEYKGKAQKDYAAAGAEDASEVKARILRGMQKRVTVGWEKTCNCDTDEVMPCVVLDPFGGSGTTSVAAMRLGRASIYIDVSEEYWQMAIERLQWEQPRLL